MHKQLIVIFFGGDFADSSNLVVLSSSFCKFNANNSLTVSWIQNDSGRCCKNYKIFISTEEYTTMMNSYAFPIKNETANASLYCRNQQGQLVSGVKIEIDPSTDVNIHHC